MKINFIGIVAFALASFAIAKETNKVINCDPSINYVWYQVNPALQIPCGSYAGITQTQLVLTKHTALTTTNPLGDNDTAGFQLSLDEAIETFGCLNAATFVCYIAYDPADVNTTKFNRITLSSGEIVWAPKTDANKPTPVCAICRHA